MPLITTLKKEHRAIQTLMEELMQMGISSETRHSKLLKSKALILDHLRKEDELLYPALARVSEAQGLADQYQADMKAISKDVLEFYEKYSDDIEDSMAFVADMGRILGALKIRIDEEETLLYPKYSHYCEKSAD